MLIGKQAPAFSCKAVIDGEIKDISLDDYKGQTKVIFFYPLDFSFICPTELHAFQDALTEFEKRKTAVLGISVDSVYSHLAWLAQPKDQGGIKGVTFPLLSDITKSIAQSYNALDEVEGIAFRALCIIDKNNIIQSMQINNLSLGRNINEVLRLVDAVDFVETHGEVCPANWSLGKEGLAPTHAGVVDYFHKAK
ncbi:MAG: peroxiredoxin [Streptosporangiaceae bacterium]